MQGDEESPMSMQVSLNTSSILVLLTEEEMYDKNEFKRKDNNRVFIGYCIKDRCSSN